MNPRTAPAESARTRIGCTTAVGIVARSVTASVFDGQLGDRHLDDGQLVGTGVRRRVPVAQDTGERFAGGVEEAEHRVEPEPAFEVRCRSLLAFGVDLDQRRVDVQHHLLGCRHRRPTLSLGPVRGRPATRRARCHRCCRRRARSSGRRRPRRTRRAGHATPPCPPRSARRRRASPRPDRAGGRGRDRRRVHPPTGSRPNTPM